MDTQQPRASVSVTTRIPERELGLVEVAARLRGLSRSGYIARAAILQADLDIERHTGARVRVQKGAKQSAT